MISIIIFLIVCFGCIALRKKGLWDKKVKDIDKLDMPDVQASEVRIGTIVKIVIYAIVTIAMPVVGITIVLVFELLPWAFRSNSKEDKS